MKKLAFLTVFFFLTTVGLVFKFIVVGDVQKHYDGRVAVKVNQDEVNYIREKMRGFLSSFQEVADGIAKENYEEVASAARRSGKFIRDNAPAGLVGKVPLRFKSLGFDTQDRFDVLAQAAKEHRDPKYLLSQLSAIAKNCAACHYSYTFKVVGP